MLHYRFWLMEHSVRIVGYNRQITTSTLMLSDFLNSFINRDARVTLDDIIKNVFKTDKRFHWLYALIFLCEVNIVIIGYFYY